MSSFALSGEKVSRTCTRVNDGGFDDHSSILDEFLYVCAGVGVPDFGLLSWVEPDFTLSDACDSCGEPLLRTEIDLQKSSVFFFMGSGSWKIDPPIVDVYVEVSLVSLTL